MATADYTELDKLILARINARPAPSFTMLCELLGSEAGKITFVNKAWHLT